MFDCRCALDHLIYELHLRLYGQQSAPADVMGRTMFPIHDNECAFTRRGAPRIEQLGRRERCAIKHLQPFVTRQDEWRNVPKALSPTGDIGPRETKRLPRCRVLVAS